MFIKFTIKLYRKRKLKEKNFSLDKSFRSKYMSSDIQLNLNWSMSCNIL